MQTADLKRLLPADRQQTIEHVRDRLTVLGRYGKGWDGYHADPMKLESANDALLYAGQNELPAALHVTMDGDGEVAFYFETDGRRRLLEFSGNGAFHTSERFGDRWEYLGETPITEQAAQAAALARKKPVGDRMRVSARD